MRVLLSIVMATLILGLASRPSPALQVRDTVSPLDFIHVIDAETGWAMTAYCGPCPPHVVSGLLLRTTSGGIVWADARPVDSSGQRIDVGFLYANSDIA